LSIRMVAGFAEVADRKDFLVAGGGFESPTFGLCDLTHFLMRVGLYLHPGGVLAIQSLRLPRFRGLVRYCPIACAT